jgi:hypothetical protein
MKYFVEKARSSERSGEKVIPYFLFSPALLLSLHLAKLLTGFTLQAASPPIL